MLLLQGRSILFIISHLPELAESAYTNRFTAKKRGAFRSAYLSTCDNDSHGDKTFQITLSAPCFLRCCVCPAWASGIEDTKLFRRVKVPYARELMFRSISKSQGGLS
jgi:hypothetical protein